MAGRSLVRALADPTASSTTVEGIGGLPRDPSPSLRAEERLRAWGRGSLSRWRRALAAGPLGRMRRWQAALLIMAIFLTSLGLGVYFGPASLTSTPPLQTAFLYDRDGRFIGQIRAEENRVVVPLDQIPKVVQNAFIAVEDARFWSHAGIDPIAIARSVLAYFCGEHDRASTITQPLVKNETVVG